MSDSGFKPFYATVLFLHPLKTSENQMFSGDKERDKWHEMGYLNKSVHHKDLKTLVLDPLTH